MKLCKTYRTVRGERLRGCATYREGNYWRWKIITQSGREIVDGGNYVSFSAADRGMIEAFDPLPPPTKEDIEKDRIRTIFARAEAGRRAI
jgi:hypothetical protein